MQDPKEGYQKIQQKEAVVPQTSLRNPFSRNPFKPPGHQNHLPPSHKSLLHLPPQTISYQNCTNLYTSQFKAPTSKKKSLNMLILTHPNPTVIDTKLRNPHRISTKGIRLKTITSSQQHGLFILKKKQTYKASLSFKFLTSIYIISSMNLLHCKQLLHQAFRPNSMYQ